MQPYRVVKRIKLDGVVRNVGEVVQMDERRAAWSMQQKLIAPIGAAADIPALVKPKPIARRCCGR